MMRGTDDYHQLANEAGGSGHAPSHHDHSAIIADSPCNSQTMAPDGGLQVPTMVCTYYAKGIKGIGQGCLRVNCKFFHGTEEQLAELRVRCEEGGEHVLCEQRVRQPLIDVDLGDKRPIVCLAYLSNACRRPGCRFLHLPSNVRPLPIAVCECFTRGTCTRKRCRFFHGTQAVLSRMHAQGVTMYNPITNEAHDPAASLEELMQLQERTTVPLSAATPAPIYVFVNAQTAVGGVAQPSHPSHQFASSCFLSAGFGPPAAHHEALCSHLLPRPPSASAGGTVMPGYAPSCPLPMPQPHNSGLGYRYNGLDDGGGVSSISRGGGGGGGHFLDPMGGGGQAMGALRLTGGAAAHQPSLLPSAAVCHHSGFLPMAPYPSPMCLFPSLPPIHSDLPVRNALAVSPHDVHGPPHPQVPAAVNRPLHIGPPPGGLPPYYSDRF